MTKPRITRSEMTGIAGPWSAFQFLYRFLIVAWLCAIRKNRRKRISRTERIFKAMKSETGVRNKKKKEIWKKKNGTDWVSIKYEMKNCLNRSWLSRKTRLYTSSYYAAIIFFLLIESVPWITLSFSFSLSLSLFTSISIVFALRF